MGYAVQVSETGVFRITCLPQHQPWPFLAHVAVLAGMKDDRHEVAALIDDRVVVEAVLIHVGGIETVGDKEIAANLVHLPRLVDLLLIGYSRGYRWLVTRGCSLCRVGAHQQG
jgi:hypothetical protein